MSDSQAPAGVLKQGVRVGDRSRMYIARPPGRGQPRLTPRTGRAKTAPTPNRSDWFWTVHGALASRASARRWETALKSLVIQRATGKALASEGTVRQIAADFRPQITEAARRYNLSEALILAVILVESAGEPKARSAKGAEGLMQLIPATAARFGVRDSYDPQANIMGGAAYLAWLLQYFREDPLLALAGYNAGEAAIKKYRGVPPYRETRDYVVKVLDAVVAAKRICGSLPASPRATCRLR